MCLLFGNTQELTHYFARLESFSLNVYDKFFNNQMSYPPCVKLSWAILKEPLLQLVNPNFTLQYKICYPQKEREREGEKRKVKYTRRIT